jgi:hypothetical protein
VEEEAAAAVVEVAASMDRCARPCIYPPPARAVAHTSPRALTPPPSPSSPAPVSPAPVSSSPLLCAQGSIGGADLSETEIIIVVVMIVGVFAIGGSILIFYYIKKKRTAAALTA